MRGKFAGSSNLQITTALEATSALPGTEHLASLPAFPGHSNREEKAPQQMYKPV